MDQFDHLAGQSCHFHEECVRTWTLKKDECPVCKAGINPKSILTDANLRARASARKAEEEVDRVDQEAADAALAVELARQGAGVGAGAVVAVAFSVLLQQGTD